LYGVPGDSSFILDQHACGKPDVKLRKPEKLLNADGDAGTRLAERAAAKVASGGKWPGKGQPKGRRSKLAVVGLSSEILDAGDPRYATAVRHAAAYRKQRARELCVSHGYVSSGASALLATAALAMAGSRFLYEKFAECADVSMLKLAARLADSARQNELAAWELASREGVAKKRSAMADQGIPWLAKVDEEKRRPGRPRKKDQVESDAADLRLAGHDISQAWAVDPEQETDDGVEGNRGGEVSVLSGVPGHGPEPDGSAGEVHTAGDAAPSVPSAAAPEGCPNPEAPGHAGDGVNGSYSGGD
jgi:hypothetical protein